MVTAVVEKDRRHNKIWLNFKQFGVKLLRARLENFGIVRFHDRGPFLTEAGHFLEVRFRESLFIDFLGSVHVHVAQEDVRYGTYQLNIKFLKVLVNLLSHVCSLAHFETFLYFFSIW